MTTTAGPAPAAAEDRSKNHFRPQRLADVVGQEKAKRQIRRAIDACYTRRRPLRHALFLGPAGTGKSTLSHAIGNELGVDVYDVEAPVSYEQLADLRTIMYDGDILRVEEIHQQAIMERRGRSTSTQPEVLYSVMEDRVLQSPNGPLDFPRITLIGTTTDAGMLPRSFLDRFILKPRLIAYTRDEMVTIAEHNARVLEVTLTPDAASVFATASRGVPRQMNTFMELAADFGTVIDRDVANEVLEESEVTRDGLDGDMQAMLTFLLTRCRLTTGAGEVRYQASVNTIATATGHSRDSKAIVLHVEPYLIERGFVQVTPSGRRLTDRGIDRGERLLEDVGV